MTKQFELIGEHSDILRKYCGYDKDVVVPEGIREIAQDAFSGRSLRSISLPETLVHIHRSAFRRCRALERLVIPGSVRVIDQEAFDGCDSLKTLILEEGICEIGMRAFWYCSALQEVAIPASVTRVGSKAFEGCSQLKKVTLKNPGTFVDEYAFRETAYSLRLIAQAERCAQGLYTPEILELPEGMTHIDTYAYSGRQFKKLLLPSSLRTVGRSAFSNCTQLTEITISPNSYCNYHGQYLPGDGIFCGCAKLEHVYFKGPLKRFIWFDAEKPELLRGFHPEKTFFGCFSLQRMTAWEIPLHQFPAQWQGYAINGYLSDPQRRTHYLPEVAAEYDAHLGGLRVHLIKRAQTAADFGLCHYLMDKQWILRDEFDALLHAATQAQHAELCAALLNYKQRAFAQSANPLAAEWEALMQL